jgi:hypothetical protein
LHTARPRACTLTTRGCDCAELKYEIDKIQASQRLDLNLEKGRIRDELLTQNNKSIQTGSSVVGCGGDGGTSDAADACLFVPEIRLDKEINSMRTTLEANKNDIIRFCALVLCASFPPPSRTPRRAF